MADAEQPSPEPTGAPRLRLRVSALSDVGRVRKDNQDSGYAGSHLIAVADGVGGAARGDVASSTAIAAVRALDAPPGNDPARDLGQAIHRAHRQIAGIVREHPEVEGTSTTVTLAVFDGDRLAIAHVGDSRGYLLRQGRLEQVTTDHTFVQSLIDEGRITEEEARVHPHRNLILRAVDGLHEPEPDVFLIEVEAGDRILLCSDGASGVLDRDQLTTLLGQGTVDFAAVEIVTAALEAGSSDNVTVVLADVVDEDAEDPEETASVTLGPLLVGAAAEQPRLAPLSEAARASLKQQQQRDTGELDPVPSGPTHNEGEDVDPEALRYAPREPHRFGWLRRLAALAVVGVLVWLGAAAGYAWTQRQYYVGTSSDDVAIFQGVQANLPVLDMNHVYESTGVRVADLPEFNRKQVQDGMSADDLADAREIVTRLEQAADCNRSREAADQPTASPSATPKSRGSATARPSASASPSEPAGADDPCQDVP